LPLILLLNTYNEYVILRLDVWHISNHARLANNN
jgi:hypothetical protein